MTGLKRLGVAGVIGRSTGPPGPFDPVKQANLQKVLTEAVGVDGGVGGLDIRSFELL